MSKRSALRSQVPTALHPTAQGPMIQGYFRAMDALHHACVAIAGTALVIITIIIPYGVFTRYVLNSASSWPEPLAILLMIVISFLSAVICYREHLHISVGMLPNALTGVPRDTITSTFMRTKSFAKSANRSLRPSADRYSMIMFFPSTYPRSSMPLRKLSS